jgi:hypothetical protein
VKVFVEIYLVETNKEHRNFLFQVFDQIQENEIKEGQSLDGDPIRLGEILAKVKR